MRAKKFYIQTKKETSSTNDIISYQLMIKAGIIKKIASGIYNYMPLGMKILRKIENIVREELNNAGAIEILMPIVQPAELWKESSRFKQYGPELLKLQDRHKREFVLQPTSEEVMTDIARNEIHSYKQLPLILYHIQTKFRDEIRPRFGLIRGREFIMKDAYSFDINEESAILSYQIMFNTYEKIFNKLGLKFKAVSADTGSIGGSKSHEFHIMAKNGEDKIAYNDSSKFAYNVELAEAPNLIKQRAMPTQSLKEIYTPNLTKCSQIAKKLNVFIEKTIKSIVLTVSNNENIKIFLLLLRGDHTLNEIKANKISILSGFRFSTKEEINKYFNCNPGFIGPVNVSKDIIIIADKTVNNMSDFICGANKNDMHFVGVNWSIDLPEPDFVADLRNIEDGDPNPYGNGVISVKPGIEIGHIFYLGTKYSKQMKASYLDRNGKNHFLEMGCYGIGISRIMGAAIEQYHDEKGILWPKNIAPFQIVICPIGFNEDINIANESNDIYKKFTDLNFDIILDDRNIRFGHMLTEWELIGIPIMIIISKKLIEIIKLK
ncbi:Proline--tRNA ligase [Candidatus Kinetoplastibacterium sorsogonicusi]|uniref:Proline--tRNA ligase n=1 Tax=Candidatus Kinetoplastidibacterium kentomonadis TaxID=1576550 RepID=A0A3Q8ETY3_9PROT|nr:proline--tRNA ligase [Candidatus Kinetoplastibacterium sorsogonicusi]AWD32669.1 Proline--tRNA ligase [Candidatus Kinetoplastibacterium sorsogonicusi]